MQFKYDYIILILSLLAILGLVSKIFLFRNSKTIHYTSSLKRIKALKEANPIKEIFRKIITIFYYLQVFTIIFLLILISARPQKIVSEDISKEGVDIVILIDSSGSMDETDIIPSRRYVAYEAIRMFVSNKSSNRIGLVAFLGSTATLVPLTYDHSLISESLEMITFDLFMFREDEFGTAVGDAIVSGVSRFPADSDRTKVIILITDGESTTGVDLEKSALFAKENNVTVYPLFMSKTNEAGSKDGMRKVAAIFGVPLYEPNTSDNMNSIMNDIDKLEKGKAKVPGSTALRDNPQPYLYALGIFIPLFLGTKTLKKYVLS